MGEPIVKRYMELQMEELKEALADQGEAGKSTPKKEEKDNSKNAELAKMYEDCYEYEKDLEIFEQELVIVKANEVSHISAALREAFPTEDRDYEAELKNVLLMGWNHFIQQQKSDAQGQLELIEKVGFTGILPVLQEAYPAYAGDFEKEIRDLLVKRWDHLIAIKKEHIQEELDEIETAGLKHHYVKRVYKEYHGITD